jgi:hypothetical protein
MQPLPSFQTMFDVEPSQLLKVGSRPVKCESSHKFEKPREAYARLSPLSRSKHVEAGRSDGWSWE